MKILGITLISIALILLSVFIFFIVSPFIGVDENWATMIIFHFGHFIQVSLIALLIALVITSLVKEKKNVTTKIFLSSLLLLDLYFLYEIYCSMNQPS